MRKGDKNVTGERDAIDDRPTISISCKDDPTSKETFLKNWNNARPCAFMA